MNKYWLEPRIFFAGSEARRRFYWQIFINYQLQCLRSTNFVMNSKIHLFLTEYKEVASWRLTYEVYFKQTSTRHVYCKSKITLAFYLYLRNGRLRKTQIVCKLLRRFTVFVKQCSTGSTVLIRNYLSKCSSYLEIIWVKAILFFRNYLWRSVSVVLRLFV